MLLRWARWARCTLGTLTYVWCTSLWPSVADKLEVLGLEPMLTVLQKLGLSTKSVPSSGQPFDWLQTVGQTQRMLGLNIMVGFWVSQDVRNTSRNLMVVSIWSPTVSHSCTSMSVHTYFCAHFVAYFLALQLCKNPSQSIALCIICRHSASPFRS